MARLVGDYLRVDVLVAVHALAVSRPSHLETELLCHRAQPDIEREKRELARVGRNVERRSDMQAVSSTQVSSGQYVVDLIRYRSLYWHKVDQANPVLGQEGFVANAHRTQLRVEQQIGQKRGEVAEPNGDCVRAWFFECDRHNA